MNGQDKKMENLERSQETMDELHMLDRDLAALSQGIQLQPSKEFTSRVMKGISTPVPVQIYWFETPLRAAAAILLLATFIGLNAFSLKSITELSGNSIQPSEQEFVESEFSMEDLGWLSADYPQIVSE
jgi:hypothetical protein